MEIEQAFAGVQRLKGELARKERAIGRKVQTLARGLATLMEPGEHLYRRGVGLHAFDVGGAVCLAAAYLEEAGGRYAYRYAVLCGGEAARRALRDARLDPGDSDEPGATRRITLARYPDYVDFVDRLTVYLADLNRRFEANIRGADETEGPIGEARRRVAVTRRSRKGAREAGHVR
jgi:hypothetical protein